MARDNTNGNNKGRDGMFSAILIEKSEAVADASHAAGGASGVGRRDTGQRASYTQLDEAALPPGNVAVHIAYSTLNYKDALAITGKGAVVRQFPMVPGIDFAGVVDTSTDPRYKPGDKVLLNGWGVGESHWGGLAQRANVQGEWLIPLPTALTSKQAMAVGTAGFTAMLSVLALEHNGVTPDQGEILVTGAGGGVGGIAIALLHKLGFRVVASTGRPAQSDYLRALGADEVIDRATLSAPGKPLVKERWAGVIDSVGSHTLANACAATRQGGTVTACGLAQGMDFPSTVAPFILRGVTLAGINSVYQTRDVRLLAWQRLATDLDLAKLETMTHEVGLSQAIDEAGLLLEGKVRGRRVVDVNR